MNSSNICSKFVRKLFNENVEIIQEKINARNLFLFPKSIMVTLFNDEHKNADD